MSQAVKNKPVCYHCGEACSTECIKSDNRSFCCEGCAMVYKLLSKNGLCEYYSLSERPGITRKEIPRTDKFSFLDDEKIERKLVAFKDGTQTHISIYLPQIHCTSCLWLLENINRIEQGIISCKVNFERKEAEIVFLNSETSLRGIADLLTSIGYEPYISLNDLAVKTPGGGKDKIYKLGVAGFCFANIMLLNFPEYLGIDSSERYLQNVFRYISLFLSLPVLFYSASEFYLSAFKSIRHKFMNIDAPIVFSVLITFGRSLYEIISGTGSGYLDSMSGIVFFMLVGRVLQDRSYAALNFERDYTSYFPLAVTKVVAGKDLPVTLRDIRLNDTLLIHNQELIPADGILTRGHALIDYSFVTGESYPIKKEMGEIIYAGGKHIGANIELLVIKEVAQGYLTRLWNRQEFKKGKKEKRFSFVELLSRYFTWIIFLIAIITGVYWSVNDPQKMWNAVTAVLIIACPCGLLLSNTFTNGNILRRLARNNFYLKNAQTIEAIAKIDHIVFDKTGTLTTGGYENIVYEGTNLDTNTKNNIVALAAQSLHPFCRAISAMNNRLERPTVTAFNESLGDGIEGFVEGELIMLGSSKYVLGKPIPGDQSSVYVAVEGKTLGRFVFKNQYRKGVPALIGELTSRFAISFLSGDNDGESGYLQNIAGRNATLLFNRSPVDKLESIKNMQQNGDRVMMIGDGLNDAGALKQADVGISIVETNNSFTPSSDAILNVASLPKIPSFIKLCQFNKTIVLTAFAVSAVYNIIGLYFAISGNMQSVIAAILMPCSSISILFLTFGLSNLRAKQLSL